MFTRIRSGAWKNIPPRLIALPIMHHLSTFTSGQLILFCDYDLTGTNRQLVIGSLYNYVIVLNLADVVKTNSTC